MGRLPQEEALDEEGPVGYKESLYRVWVGGYERACLRKTVPFHPSSSMPLSRDDPSGEGVP